MSTNSSPDAIVSVVVAIGRKIGNQGENMADWAWDAFKVNVRRSLTSRVLGTIHAEVDGASTSGGYGAEQAAWFAASVPVSSLPLLRQELAVDARMFRQESIALTVGAVEFVGAADGIGATCV